MITDKFLLSELHQLPENLKEDVFHYIEFLKTRYMEQSLAVSKTEKKEQKSTRKFGSAKGKYCLSPDFNKPLEDFNDYMWWNS